MRKVVFVAFAFFFQYLVAQNITGIVNDEQGKPMPGVCVSDGFDIVKTNAKGEYALQSKKRMGYVFVISPSGYTVPLKADGMRADFWKKLQLSADKKERVDFKLVKQNQDKYNVMLTTDIHLNRHPRQHDLMYFHEYAMPNIKALEKKYRKESVPLYVFHLGDVSTDAHWYEFKFPIDSAYARLVQEGFPGPLYNIPGNHDNNPHVIGDNVDFRSEESYRNVFGPTYYSMNIGKDHWIMMDNIIYVNTIGGKNIKIIADASKDTIPRVRGHRDYKVGFTKKQIAWLKKDLEMMPKDMTVRLCTHASFLFEYPKGKGTQFTDDSQVDTVIALLAKYDGKVHAYNGHTHRLQFAHNEKYPEIESLMLPAVSGNVWGSGNNHMLGIDGSDAGVMMAHFNGKEVTYDYTTHCFGEKYIRLYDMNTVVAYYQTDSLTLQHIKDFPQRTNYGLSEYKNWVYANVWDVRPTDVVKIYEDGKELPTQQIFQGEPIYPAVNHLAKNALAGPQYQVCYHLFGAQAKTANKPITVKVFDAQGTLRHSETMKRPKPFTPEMK